jgi:hypothetical protein
LGISIDSYGEILIYAVSPCDILSGKQLSHKSRNTCNYVKEASLLLAALFIVPIIVRKYVFQEFVMCSGFFIMFTDSVSPSVEYSLVSFFTVFQKAFISFLF